jgi:hypothetical protein
VLRKKCLIFAQGFQAFNFCRERLAVVCCVFQCRRSLVVQRGEEVRLHEVRAIVQLREAERVVPRATLHECDDCRFGIPCVFHEERACVCVEREIFEIFRQLVS